MNFYDRDNELKLLNDIEKQSNSVAQFTVIKGRRRIGKTRLLLKAMKGKDYVYLFVGRGSEAIICQKFQTEIEQSLGISIYGTLTHFSDVFELLLKESTKRHFSVIIDEVQNFQYINNLIFSEMQRIWDQYQSASKINLIVCGSIRTMMRHIFENQSEPLYGRATSKINLRPFPTHILKQIMSDYCPNYKPDDLLALYMITGGVAKYVELLIDNRCFTKNKMFDFFCREDSYFLSEGKELMANEFSNEFDTYFSILQVVSAGKTRLSEIDNLIGKPSGVYLSNLEKNYEMVSKIKPILAKPNTKTTQYQINDNFMRFWFRFVFPYQSLIECGQHELLRQNITDGYERFSVKTLEKYFQTKLMESGQFTQIGNWWNRKGENEIDIIALNDFNHTGIVAEVKRNPSKISISALKEKFSDLPASDFGHYNLSLQGFSLEDI